MQPKIALGATVLALALLTPALAPSPQGSPLLPTAGAQTAKSFRGGGAQNIGGAGKRFGDLLSGWGVPVLIAVAGVLLVGALGSRNFGTAVGIVLVTMVGLIFLLAPAAIEDAATSIAQQVF